MGRSSILDPVIARLHPASELVAAQREFRKGSLYVRCGGKRFFDIAFAAAVLLLLLPVLPLIALALFIEDGSPVLFSQRRIGRSGHSFECLKFRSMVRDADRRFADLLATCADSRQEWEETQKLKRDPRIHALGALLRRLSVDELPQLWNVLRGDMSIVGPRPILPEQVARYRHSFGGYAKVRPGLTGPWQVGGRSHLTFEQRIELDGGYAGQVSFLGDLKILLKTVRVVLTADGSC